MSVIPRLMLLASVVTAALGSASQSQAGSFDPLIPMSAQRARSADGTAEALVRFRTPPTEGRFLELEDDGLRFPLHRRAFRGAHHGSV